MTVFFATVSADSASLAGVAGDQVSFANATVANVISLNPFITQSGWAAGDRYGAAIGIFTLSSFGDFFAGDGRSLTIYGGAGGDSIWSLVSAGNVAYAFGGLGNDLFISSVGVEHFDGGAGALNTVGFNGSSAGVTASLADQSINTGDAAGDTYVNIQDLQGSTHDDTLHSVADGKSHQLIGDPGVGDGVGGNDTLYGATGPNAGYTNFIGGAGADKFYLGDGGNLIDYETAGAGLTASLANMAMNTGDAAGDLMFASPSGSLNIDLAGTPFADTLYGNDGNNNIIGDPFDPKLYGAMGGNDTIYGLGGDDILDGGPGGDTLDGGTGINLAGYNVSPIGVTADLANTANNTGNAAGDVYINIQGLFGSRFNDILRGDGGANRLFGGQGDDALYGADGDDLFNGGDGADFFDGGAGYDSVGYDDSSIGLTIDLTTPSNSTGMAAGDTFAAGTIESIVGTRFSDVIVASATGTVIDGGAGNDVIRGAAGTDGIFGGLGADTLSGGGGPDAFVYRSVAESSGANIDTITDFATDVDIVDISAIAPQTVVITRTGAGGSILTATSAQGTLQVNLTTNLGGDDLRGLTRGITVNGTSGGEALVGSDFDDVITGNGGADILSGRDGADIFKITAAADSPTNAPDTITDFQTGRDKLDLSALNPTSVALFRAGGVTQVTASTAQGDIQINVPFAIFVSDILGVTSGITTTGDDTGETLIGTQFADILQGNGGQDSLRGGAGADTFRYAKTSDSTSAAMDILQDFETGIDKLDLTAIAPRNVSIIHTGIGSQIFADAAGGSFAVGAATLVNASDIVGLTGGVYLVGSSAGETLRGTSFSDLIDGNGGADNLYGGAGADTFRYFTASDSTASSLDIIQDFQSGVDRIDLGALNATSLAVFHSGGGTQLYGGSAGGSFALAATSAFDGGDLVGATSGIYLVGDNTSENLRGTGANDTIDGNGGADSLFGGGGADTFRFLKASDSTASSLDIIRDFQSGVDRIDLGALNATSLAVFHSGGGTQLYGGSAGGSFALAATTAFDGGDLVGVTSAVYLSGDGTGETLRGTAYNDTIDGNGGADALFGGAGADTFRFLRTSDSTSAAMDILQDFQTGLDRLDLSQIPLSTSGAQQVTIVNSGGGSTLYAAATDGSFALGSNTLVSASDIVGLTKGVYLVGSSAGETLRGTSFSDLIDGNGGADNLYGGAGADTFRYFTASDSTASSLDIIQDFQSGVDRIDLGALNATSLAVFHSGGGTQLYGGSAGGSFALAATSAFDGGDLVGATSGIYLVGDNTSENLRGTGANDTIDGNGGADSLFGGGGADTFRFLKASDSTASSLDIIRDFQSGVDRIDLGALNATSLAVFHSGGGTQLYGGSAGGSFALAATTAFDGGDLVGVTSAVYLSGDGTGETLRGTAYNDTIDGNGGADALFGGAGADTFRFLRTSDSTSAAMDILQDFQTGLDRLDLSQIPLSTSGAQQVTIVNSGGGSTLYAAATDGSFALGSNTLVSASDIVGLTKGVYLVGSSAGETLRGTSFSDLIDGNGGADNLYGGAGADTFRYFTASDSTPGAPDVIQDFQIGSDIVNLAIAHTGASDLLKIDYSGANTTISVDHAGKGVDMSLSIINAHLTMSDLIW